jgi:flagellar biosynthesis protein FliR
MTSANDVFDLIPILSGALMIGMRVSGMMVFAPFLAGPAIPMRVKAGFVLAVTALLASAHTSNATVGSPFDLARIIAGELLVGLLLGLSVAFVMDAVQLAGQILGVQMGFSLVNIIDPQTQVDTPVLSTFNELIALLLFLQMNVHHWLLRGLERTFTYLPAGTMIADIKSADVLLRAAGGIFLAGLQIAAPTLAATLVADIMLGFLGKASPNLPILFLGLSVKSLLGLAVMVAVIAAWPTFLEKHFTAAIGVGEHLLHLAR